MGPAHVVGAAVIDGSGRDPSNLDITIENGRITQLGASSAPGERLDAEGLWMTPGLIDAHVHLGLQPRAVAAKNSACAQPARRR
ncbi:hypothetical protein [Streptomyces atroolivaceus]|uniref:hypothetical protein n=1 Tax=Streptomyces atroolivaceus TaxID=66869 RepID=UPI00363999DF